MTSVRRAWLLNFDAEEELKRPRGYSIPADVAARIREHRHLAEDLRRGEPAIDGEAGHGTPCEQIDLALAWCPTPSALATIRRLGIRAPAAPALEVLREVNHRRFQHALARAIGERSPWLDQAEFVEPEHDTVSQARGIVARLASPSRPGGWHLERPYGFAGRGGRRILRRPNADDERWLEESLRQGGILIEPYLAVELEICIHGYVDDEVVLLGTPCVQTVDSYGAPRAVCLASNVTSKLAHFTSALVVSADRAALALRSAGYFGPFGIDALVFSHEGTSFIATPTDLNARFTLGWSLGMNALRETALARMAFAEGSWPSASLETAKTIRRG